MNGLNGLEKWKAMPESKKRDKAGKAVSKQPSAVSSRRIKPPIYKTLKLAKRIKHPAKLPSAFKIFKKAIIALKANWRLFIVLTLIYGILTIILVRGLGGSLDLSSIKDTLKEGFSGSYASLLTGISLFSILLSTAGSSSNQSGGVYQSLLVVIMSLAVIWALRQIQAKHKVSAKQAFYQSTYPLIPFVLVLLIVGLQLIPLAVGSWLYSTVVNNAIAISGLEKFIWALMAMLLSLFSLYMLCSSLFALYIVTLPDMTPLKALRSARQLVLHRRWAVLIKILFLPVALLILGAIIMIPIIIYLTFLAEWSFFLLSMFTLVVVHAYMYTLYRELL